SCADEVQTYSGISPVTERRVNGNGCTSAGRVRSFCDKVFTNGPVTRLGNRRGLEPITSNNASEARTTMPRCERWSSNGFESYSVAGGIGFPMTKTNIWQHLLSEAHR